MHTVWPMPWVGQLALFSQLLQCSKSIESKYPIFAFFCVSLLVSLEMQVQEGPNLVHMYRHHCLLCICNKISLSLKLSVYFRCIVYAFFCPNYKLSSDQDFHSCCT